MQPLLRLVAWIFLVLVFLASILFSFFNTEAIALSFGFMVLQPQPLAVWIVSAFALGGCIGLLLGAGLLRGIRNRLEVQRLKSRLAALERDYQDMVSRKALQSPGTMSEKPGEEPRQQI